MNTCSNCKGSGIDPVALAPLPGEESTPCQTCSGSGKVQVEDTQVDSTDSSTGDVTDTVPQN